MATEFLLLGPLIVRIDGAPVTVCGGKLRAVLAGLLLSANRVVTVDDLAEVLWGEHPPSKPQAGVQNFVLKLRRALGPAGSRVITQPRGYLIRVQAGEVDLDSFEDLLRDARTAAGEATWPDAADRAAEALALWRGEPLGDVDSDLLLTREGARLCELRLQAMEIRIDAELWLGRHGEVIGELRQLAAEQPLRERLHGLLMLALYRDGRQAEALAAYQDARRVLVAEVGAEPGPDLQQLHQQILAADPALARSAASAQASTPAVPVPRELPGDVSGFTGRAGEIAELDRLLRRCNEEPGDARATAAVISAVSGTAGVGKTALAVHWAHHAATSFPDGQLYVNLRGYDPDRPVTAAEALAAFLRSLGVPSQDIPPDVTERAARYRSLLAGKRMIVLLDNASTVEQVRPLLPGHPGCVVVVTSRDSLAGLAARDGAKRLDLDLLPLADATALLRELIGARVDGDNVAAVTLAGQCARLPLALRIAADLAAARPRVSLASLVAELSDQRQLLDVLQADGDPATSVRAVFSWSTRQLSTAAARLFRLLGLNPGADVSLAAAASLAAVEEAEVRRLLGELTRAHLIAEHMPGRYALHDLLRAWAAEQVRDTDSQDDRDAATGRVLDHYLHTAARAVELLDPSREPVALAPARPGAILGQPADSSQALAWFKAEHQVLLAAVALADTSGSDIHAWQLPWAMGYFLRARGHWVENAAAQRTALAAAARLGDAAAQAASSRRLAIACSDLGDHDQALGHYASSLALYQQLGDRLGEAKIQQNLGLLAGRQRRYADALGHVERARDLYQAIGDTARQAQALSSIGACHGQLGDYQQARASCQRALDLCAGTGDRMLEGNAWDGLGYAEHHLGNLAEAAACYQRALSLHREAGDRFFEAGTLTRLGDTRHAAGDLTHARQAWQQALDILDHLQHPSAAKVRAKLTSTDDQACPKPSQ